MIVNRRSNHTTGLLGVATGSIPVRRFSSTGDQTKAGKEDFKAMLKAFPRPDRKIPTAKFHRY